MAKVLKKLRKTVGYSKLKFKAKEDLQNRGFTFREIESVLQMTCYDFDAMSYEGLARKYRPIDFNEVIGQDHVVKALINGINQEKIHQAFIFSGPESIGKTTIARIIQKCLNCESNSKPTRILTTNVLTLKKFQLEEV